MSDDLLAGVDGLLAQTQRQHDAQQAQAAADYRELVRRADKPQKGDADKALSLISVLGLTVQRFKADVNAWQKHQRRRADIIDDKAKQKLLDAVNTAVDAVEKHARDAAVEGERLNRLLADATHARDAANLNSDAAERDCKQIKAQHAHLFDAAGEAA